MSDPFDHLGMIEQALSVLADKLDTKQGHEISEDAIRHADQIRNFILIINHILSTPPADHEEARRIAWLREKLSQSPQQDDAG